MLGSARRVGMGGKTIRLRALVSQVRAADAAETAMQGIVHQVSEAHEYGGRRYETEGRCRSYAVKDDVTS